MFAVRCYPMQAWQSIGCIIPVGEYKTGKGGLAVST